MGSGIKRLYWQKCNNWGDKISEYLFRKITNSEPLLTIPERNSEDTIYMVSGSIMGDATDNCVVWGSGFGSEDEEVNSKPKCLAVRGYKTLHKLDLPPDTPVGDPAFMMPLYYNPFPKKKYKLGIIPHFKEYEAMRLYTKTSSNHDGIKIIDILSGIEDFIVQIKSCDYILSSSLHGLICAYAYGIPCKRMISSQMILGDGFKYNDFYTSIDNHDVGSALVPWKDIHDFELVELASAKFIEPNEEKITEIQTNLTKSIPEEWKI